MRNLTLWQVSSKKYFESEIFCFCYGHQEESDAGHYFVCSHSLLVSDVDTCGDVRWSTDVSELVSPENAAVNITFLGLINCVSVGFANGELLTISNKGDNCDLAGVCDNGLLAMEWSPDQELLVLVTKNFDVILMSCTFDPINELSLLSDEFGEKQFITVGWGKKETQFHGSEGKQAAKIKTEVVADDKVKDSNKIIISWRGDGNLFAVGFTREGIRHFKVFDREGNLQYTSEKQPGLGSNLSWRPSGNVIATTQILTDRHVVAFFEKNGLKHGEFDVPINESTNVVELLWSSDSEILSIVCIDDIDDTHKILLFTTSNYHWYLKQILVFKQNISKVMWDNDFDVTNNKKMHIILQNGHVYSYTWIWSIDHSNGKSEKDDALVAVIDGRKVLVSAFRHTVVPPPMFNVKIEVNSDVHSVLFAQGGKNDTNSLAINTEKKLVILEQSQRNPLQYRISQEVLLDINEFPFQHYNWYWLDKQTFLCIKVGDTYEVVEYELYDEKIVMKNCQSVHCAVVSIHSHPLHLNSAFLQLSCGEILEYTKEGIIPHDVSFPEACPKFTVLSIDNEIYFLGLSHKGGFYMMDKLIMNNVSSFFVHTRFLLLTTLKHELLCTELTKTGLNRLETYDKTGNIDVYKRKIERGAKLIMVVPKGTRAIFQMPRGNLEVIQPRPLSLKIIGEYLDSRRYFNAFDLMRKQRINLNLIYDHNPKLFIESIDVFIESIKNNSWLSLFLSDLENVDVTKTMYSSSYTENKSNEINEKKVQFVCDVIRLNLSKAADSANRVLPLLMTFVKKNTISDLEQALTIIKELKTQESAGSVLPVTSDEALKYLLYMVNVDQLFDVALGMYDFDLVLLVANKSQKDPKEYIPMLNELNEMEENYKRFTINKHLKRFESAVQYLAKCGESRHGELRTFVKYHSLYREALALFSVEDEIYKLISDDFGLYLKLKKQFVEAGIIFERAKNYDKAIECYKNALEWECVLKLAQHKSKEEYEELCWDLAKELKERKRFTEALTILEQFLKYEEIIIFAIECGQYKTALRLCDKYERRDLIENKLSTALIDEYDSLRKLLETNWSNFIKYRNRLNVVRELKKKQKEGEMYDTYGNKDNDLYSDAGSTIASSSGSGRSYRSSKNRRKHERKVASLKEGSQYEDTALVLALHSLVTSSFDLRLHVKEINIALSCLSKDEEALILQVSLEKLLKEMKDSFKQIWNNEFALEATNAAITAENVPEGFSVIPQGIATLEPHLRIAPHIQDVNWKLEGLN